MISAEFSQIFESFPSIEKIYLGSFPRDRVPKNIKQNHFAIVNTDVSSGSGLHWFCVFRYSSTILEVFDSLGIDDVKKNVLQKSFQIRGIHEIEFNLTQFQSNDSDSCGKFVLYFIVNRLHNLDHSFKDILNEIFEPNLSENEKKVEKFYLDVLKS